MPPAPHFSGKKTDMAALTSLSLHTDNKVNQYYNFAQVMTTSAKNVCTQLTFSSLKPSNLEISFIKEKNLAYLLFYHYQSEISFS